MNHKEKHELVEILDGPPFQVRVKLREFVDNAVITDEPETSVEQHRTDQQNKALHVWFEAVAQVCRDNSVDAKMVMSKVIRMNMTAMFIKEMWRALQQALFQKKSTTQLRKTGEINIIRDHFIRFFADEFQLELPPFPSVHPETTISKVRNTSVDYPSYPGEPLI